MNKYSKKWSKIFKQKLSSPFLPIISFLVILLVGVLAFQFMPIRTTLAWQPGCKIGSNASLAMATSSAVNFNFSVEDLSTSSLKNTNLKVGLSTDNCYGATVTMSSIDEGTSLDYEDVASSQKIDSISTNVQESSFAANHWGYRIEDGSGVHNYKPIPKLSAPEIVYSKTTPENTELNFNFAVKASPSLTPGSYKKNILLTFATSHALTTATFLPGTEFANIAKTLVGSGTASRFERSDTPPAIYGQLNPTPSDLAKYPKVSTIDSGTPIYLWLDGDKLLWWADTDLVYTNEDCETMFREVAGYTYDENKGLFVDLRGIDTSHTKNMKSMFASTDEKARGYSMIIGLDLSEFNTSNSENMESMFDGMRATSGIDLSKFDTRKVTTMKAMFKRSNINGLNIDAFDTSNVTDMSEMFDASRATSLNFSRFNTSKVTNMSKMFRWASTQTLDLSSFNTSNVTDMSEMFNGSGVSNLNLSNFDTSKVTNMSKMFSSQNIIGLDIHTFNTSNVTNMSDMFSNIGVSNLDILNFDTSNVTDMSGMFSYARNLVSINLSSFNTSKVEDMRSMFSAIGVSNIDLSNFNTSSVKQMNYMFSSLPNLTSLDLSNFDTSNVISMMSMFSNSEKLNYLNLSSFNTSNVTNMYGLFNGCKSMTNYDLSNFNTSKVWSMATMFKDNSSLSSLNLSNFNTSKVNRMDSMFSGTKNLTNLNISSFDTSEVSSMPEMFQATGLSTLDLSHFNTSKVLNMMSMFNSSSNLTNLNLSSFNTSRVTDMNSMFKGTTSLINLDLSSFDTKNVKRAVSMFDSSGVHRIEVAANQFDMRSIDMRYEDNSRAMFKNAINLVGGNGTTIYSSRYSYDGDYAHVDAPGNPGYFTLKH